MPMEIFSNQWIRIETHESEIPWLKIFSAKPVREFCECDPQTRTEILRALDIIERLMLEYYKPEKINIASFGNYLPHLHFHIMARFKEDSFFPEPMWGKQQRVANLKLPPAEPFIKELTKRLSKTNS